MSTVPTMPTMRCYGRYAHCAVLRPAAWGPLTVAAPILAMRSWCWQRIDDMRAGVHQKPYISLEVEVAGTALVGGTCASIRPTPAIMCMVLHDDGRCRCLSAPRGEERPGHRSRRHQGSFAVRVGLAQTSLLITAPSSTTKTVVTLSPCASAASSCSPVRAARYACRR